MYNDKPKVNNLHSHGFDESPLSGDEIDTMNFENIILYDYHEYKQKLELGKKIYEFINKMKYIQKV